MTPLTHSLRDHHRHCDELFAAAEAAVVDGQWSEAAHLLSAFVDATSTHFRTEEEALFPAFEDATGMTMGPTRMMRYEHAQMRELFDQMVAALAARDVRSFAGTAETLLILMQQHNMKEENILYPMCDRGLAAQFETLDPVLRGRLEASATASP